MLKANLGKLVSELIGTFLLVFCGTGAIVINQHTSGSITHLGIALVFGMVVAVLIFAFGDVGGAHLNPAVTLTFSLARKFPLTLILPYWIAQLSGALLASLLLRNLFPTSALLGGTYPAGSWQQSFMLELLLTFFLMLVILNVTTGAREKGITAALAIGGTVGLEALFAGPICGASMNPVRSLAPAMISGNLDYWWLYVAAPTLGALAAYPIHILLYGKQENN